MPTMNFAVYTARRTFTVGLPSNAAVRDAARACAALAGYSVDTGDAFTFVVDGRLITGNDLDRKVSDALRSYATLELTVIGGLG